MSKASDGISVVICCYNSSSRLPQTIKALSLQTGIGQTNWEIILVDNNSTDDTMDCARKELLKYEATKSIFKIIQEPKAGLSFARQCGIEHAAFDFVLFCDDDNWLSPGYLATSLMWMLENPRIGILGGLGLPEFESAHMPAWFASYQALYAVGAQGTDSGNITAQKGYVYGAGMVLRKSALNGFKLYDSVLLDRVGKKLSSGGDIEICLRVICNGHEIWYNDALTFKHFISDNRLTLEYVRKFFEDTVGTSFMLHGLMFKAGLNPSIFDSRWKRNWLGRFILQVVYLPRNLKKNELSIAFSLKLKLKEIAFVTHMKSAYDKSFQ